MLDMQLGGSWAGAPGDLGDGVAMTVDYVHVYSTIPEPGSTPLTVVALSVLLARRKRR